MDDYRTTLRRLALRDDRYIESLLADARLSAARSHLDARTRALVQIAALVALDGAPPSFMSATCAGERAGVSNEEMVGTLLAVLPVVGVSRVVSSAPNLALALGYDVAEAFEWLEAEPG